MEWCRTHYISYKALTEAKKVRKQLHQLVGKLKIPFSSGNNKSPSHFVLIRKALLEGFFDQAKGSNFLTDAKRWHYCIEMDSISLPKIVKYWRCILLQRSGRGPNGLYIMSTYFFAYGVIRRFVLTTKNYIRTVTEIEGDWLLEVAPNYYNLQNFEPNTPVLYALQKAKGKKSNSNTSESQSEKSE